MIHISESTKYLVEIIEDVDAIINAWLADDTQWLHKELSIKSSNNCFSDINDCNPNPCQNSGICTDGVKSFTCDCSTTGFTGNTCEQGKC